MIGLERPLPYRMSAEYKLEAFKILMDQKRRAQHRMRSHEYGSDLYLKALREYTKILSDLHIILKNWDVQNLVYKEAMRATEKWPLLAKGLRQIPKRDLKRLKKKLDDGVRMSYNGVITHSGLF